MSDFETASSRLKYDPDTGIFRWKINVAQRSRAGDIAGSVSKHDGYRVIAIRGIEYKASRLAFLLMTGAWPKKVMDHKNHKKDDDRWLNLREVTQQENNRNISLRKGSASGVAGVYWNKNHGKWRGLIRVSGRLMHLGYFADKLNAICARKNAEIKYNFHPNHGKPNND